MLLIVGEALVIRGVGDDVAHPSGAPAIAAWVAANLGAATAFVGAVGDDADGRLLIDRLGAAGRCVVRAALPTASALVEYHPDGSRRFEFAVRDSAATSLEPADLGDLPEHADWVHLSGSAVLFGGSLADTAVQAAQRGRAVGAVVSVDPNLRDELDDTALRARLRALCLAADVLFPSDDELRRLDLDEDELVGRGCVVCSTMAADGARLRAPSLDVTVPAVARADEVVDPDGAGDSFAGAVIAARLRGLPWDACLRLASRVVARAIAVAGPMTVALSPADLAGSGGGE